jgi:hypothetical protein
VRFLLDRILAFLYHKAFIVGDFGTEIKNSRCCRFDLDFQVFFFNFVFAHADCARTITIRVEKTNTELKEYRKKLIWLGATTSISTSQRFTSEHLGSFLAGTEDWSKRGEYSLGADLQDE